MLHNFLSDEGDNSYIPVGYTDTLLPTGEVRPGSWRVDGAGTGIVNARLTGQNHTREATRIRNEFKQYFSSDAGAVQWQDDIINRR